MCGIFGIYNLANTCNFDNIKFKTSLLKMKHRGPDAYGVQEISNKVILGHVRLSIIDVTDENNQPLQIDNRYWVTFNGEIYNYIELREELMSIGYTFRTNGDTEVLLRSYQHWGGRCVAKFNGMWAFVIYDSLTNSLFCSRDRYGVKPFNYSIIDGQFVFASEIKSILAYYPKLRIPNYSVISSFCRYSLGAEHKETWFEGILRLQPAHNILIENGDVQEYRYWNYPSIKADLDFDSAKVRYTEIFNDAVKLRMRSDVPVGTTLSSGLDSSSIVCSLRQFHHEDHFTFTAEFNSTEYTAKDKVAYKNSNIIIDEGLVVRQLANSISISTNFIQVSYENFVSELKNLLYYLESGNSSPAIVPLMQVMRTAKKKVKVVLEGQGADELIAGYTVELIVFALLDLIKRGRFRLAIKTLKEYHKHYSFFYAFKMYVRQLANKAPLIFWLYARTSNIEKVYGEKLKNHKTNDSTDVDILGFNDIVNEALMKRHKGGLVNLLHYGDAISMANSLESRLPFMDYRLVEFCFMLPWEYKLHLATGKYIHREAYKNILPEFIFLNKVKFGFITPVSQFFKPSCKLKVRPLDILLSEKCLSRGLFNGTGLIKVIDDHDKGVANHTNFLFRLLSVELWFQTFIDNHN